MIDERQREGLNSSKLDSSEEDSSEDSSEERKGDNKEEPANISDTRQLDQSDHDRYFSKDFFVNAKAKNILTKFWWYELTTI